MSTLAQDGTGDLLLTTTGGTRRLTLVTDPVQAAAQKLTNRFLLFLGEWYQDVRIGLHWFDFVAVKNPDLRAIEQYFRKVVLSVPPIVQIETLTLTLDSKRRAQLQLRALCDNGQVIVGGPGPVFVVAP